MPTPVVATIDTQDENECVIIFTDKKDFILIEDNLVTFSKACPQEMKVMMNDCYAIERC